MRLSTIMPLFVFLAAACGSDLEYPAAIPSQSPPALVQADPSSAAAGEEVTLYGLGFSAIASANVVLVEDQEVNASAYALNDDATIEAAEKVTFTVPSGMAAGDKTLSVFVIQSADAGLSSNAINFTVNP